jgi:hypothetical protein
VDWILPKRGVQKHRLEYNGNIFNVSVEGLPTDYNNTISGKNVMEIKRSITQEIENSTK